MRGAPGNTINHATSYWVRAIRPKVFVDKVDVVSGVGWDRAAKLGAAAGSSTCAAWSRTSASSTSRRSRSAMRLVSLHPGVAVDDVRRGDGVRARVPADVPGTRAPSDDELRIIRDVLDPAGRPRPRSPVVARPRVRAAHAALRPARLPRADRPDGHGLGGDAGAGGGCCNAGAFGFLAAATISPEDVSRRDPADEGAHRPALRRELPDGRARRRRDHRARSSRTACARPATTARRAPR